MGGLLRVLGGVAVGVLMLTLGGLFLAAGVEGLRAPSTHFVPVEATVLYAKPSTTRGAADTSSRNSWSVRVSLIYRYQIDGRTYRGGGLLDLGRAGSPGEAEARAARAAARYAPGARFEAFVDPGDPARSVLERRSVLWGLPALAFGAIFLATGLGGAVTSARGWWRRRRATDPEPSPAGGASVRWLDRVAIVLLVGLALTFVAVLIEQEPLTWTVLLGAIAVLALFSLRGWKR